MLLAMRRHVWVPLLVLYILLDFCTPLIDGAVSFDLDNCVDCTQVEQVRSAPPASIGRLQPGLVETMSSREALRLAPSPALAGVATRRPLLVRSDSAASGEPPDTAEDH